MNYYCKSLNIQRYVKYIYKTTSVLFYFFLAEGVDSFESRPSLTDMIITSLLAI